MRNRLMLLACFVALFFAVADAANRRFTLVIDPGHGGSDPGAKGAISSEKNINLSVALAFGRLVERNCDDVKVVYTRKTDVFVPLHERARIANRNKADLFVSIHTNALPKGRIARGIETYTLGMHRAADNFDVAKRENSVILFEENYEQHYEGFDPNSSESYIMFEFLQDRNMAQSVEMARYVQKRMCAQSGRANKGVKQAGFLVLRETSMPGCLIELGFITTRDEERYLNSSKGVEALSRGIYQAFLDYRRQQGYSGKVVYEPTPDVAQAPAAAPKTAVSAPKTTASAPKTAVSAPKTAAAASAKTVAATQTAAAVSPKAQSAAQSAASEAAKPSPASAPSALPATQAPQTAAATVDSPVAEARQTAPTSSQDAAEAQAQPTPQRVAVSAPDAPSAAPAAAPSADGQPVFKVQLMASSRPIATTDARFEGLDGVERYEEGGMFKFTCGPSSDYNAVNRLRRQLADRFPGCFVVAFVGGSKVDVNAAINIFKQNRNTK